MSDTSFLSVLESMLEAAKKENDELREALRQELASHAITQQQLDACKQAQKRLHAWLDGLKGGPTPP